MSAYLQLSHKTTIGPHKSLYHQMPCFTKVMEDSVGGEQCSQGIDGRTLLLSCNTVMSQLQNSTFRFPAGDVCVQMGCSVADAWDTLPVLCESLVIDRDGLRQLVSLHQSVALAGECLGNQLVVSPQLPATLNSLVAVSYAILI